MLPSPVALKKRISAKKTYMDSQTFIMLFILLLSGSALSMATDLALGIRWQRYKLWKWLTHVLMLVLYGALIASFLLLSH